MFKPNLSMKLSKLITSLIFSFLVASAFSQPLTRIVREAKKMYSNENYCEAVEKCEAAYKQISKRGRRAKKRKADMAFKAAECYRNIEKCEEAQEWYDKCLLLDYQEIEPNVLYLNAQMLHQMGEYEKCLKNIEEYKKLVPKDKRSDLLAESCKRAKDFKTNKSRHVVKNENAINKPGIDMSGTFGDRRESTFYFSSGRPGSTGTENDPRSCENYMDIWVSQQDKKGNWGQPVPINGELINTIDNEGAVSFDGRNKQMFFTRCSNEKQRNLGCDIWVSKKKG